MKCHSTLDSPLCKESPMYPGIWREREKAGGGVGGGHIVRGRERSKIVQSLSVTMNYTWVVVLTLSAHSPALSLLNIHTNIFVRPLLITHHNNKKVSTGNCQCQPLLVCVWSLQIALSDQVDGSTSSFSLAETVWDLCYKLCYGSYIQNLGQI